MDRTPPSFDYLLTCSQAGLESFELSRLNRISNVRKQLHELLEEWIEAEVDARLARWLLEGKRGSASSVSVVVRPPAASALPAQGALALLPAYPVEPAPALALDATAPPPTSSRPATAPRRVSRVLAPRKPRLALPAPSRAIATDKELPREGATVVHSVGDPLAAVGEGVALRQLESRARHRVGRPAEGNPTSLIRTQPWEAAVERPQAPEKTSCAAPERPSSRSLAPRPPVRVLGGSKVACDWREAPAM